MAHVAPPIPLPNIPGAPQSTSEWEAALFDAMEGYYTDTPNPWTVGRPRVIGTFNEPHVAIGPSFAAHEPGGPVDVGDPPVPMVPWVIEAVGPPAVGVYPILPRPVAARNTTLPKPAPRPVYVPPPVPVDEPDDDERNDGARVLPPQAVVIRDVEEYEEGDYPAGSIFAPGAVWGGASAHDFDAPIEPPEEEEDMSHDWGHLIREGLGAWMGGGGGAGEFNALGPVMAAGTAVARPSGRAASPPGAAPVIYDAYGRPCRPRRRRRRLLTNSDLKDLAALKTITGNNDALKMAVIKAVR